MHGHSAVITIVQILQVQQAASGSGGGGSSIASLYDANGALIGTTTDNVVLENMRLSLFTIDRTSTPGAQIGNITDGTDNEPIYAGDSINFTNLQLL